MAEKSIPEPIGVVGLTQWGGYVQEEFLRELQGKRGLQRLREMRENDPIVGGVLFSIENLVRQADWRLNPRDESAEAVEAADFVESCLHDMEHPWQDTLSEIMSFFWAGFSVHETLYKQRDGDKPDDPERSSRHDDGRIGWRGLPIRGQETVERWEFDANGKAIAFVQVAPPSYAPVTVPLKLCLHFKAGTRKGNPEGRSILRNAYTSWYYKTNIQRIEAIGIERDLAGLPVAKVPPELLSKNATADQITTLNAIKNLIRNIRRDEQEGVIFPLAYDENGKPTYELTLLTTGGARQFDTDAVVARYDQRIAMTMLADFLLLGHEATGSFALSSDKTDLFGIAIGAFMDTICGVFNHQAIPDLLRLNGIPVEHAPELGHGDIESADLDKLGEFVKALAVAGFPVNDSAIFHYLLEQAGFPAPVDEEEPEQTEQPEQVVPQPGENPQETPENPAQNLPQQPPTQQPQQIAQQKQQTKPAQPNPQQRAAEAAEVVAITDDDLDAAGDLWDKVVGGDGKGLLDAELDEAA